MRPCGFIHSKMRNEDASDSKRLLASKGTSIYVFLFSFASQCEWQVKSWRRVNFIEFDSIGSFKDHIWKHIQKGRERSFIALRVPALENHFWHKKYVSSRSCCSVPVQLNNSKREVSVCYMLNPCNQKKLRRVPCYQQGKVVPLPGPVFELELGSIG